MQNQPAQQKPQNVKNFTTAFLILSLLMLAAQVVNLIITMLPAAAEATIQLDGGTTATIASLRSSYITLLIIVGLIYGLVWYQLRKSRNWARWTAVVLAALAAIGGVQGTAQAFATGSIDVAGLSLSLAQLIAAGWVLALAFRKEVHEWFKQQATRPRNS